jgi:hypothetical protein
VPPIVPPGFSPETNEEFDNRPAWLRALSLVNLNTSNSTWLLGAGKGVALPAVGVLSQVNTIAQYQWWVNNFTTVFETLRYGRIADYRFRKAPVTPQATIRYTHVYKIFNSDSQEYFFNVRHFTRTINFEPSNRDQFQ